VQTDVHLPNDLRGKGTLRCIKFALPNAVIVSFCESGGMVGRFICIVSYTLGAGALLRKGASGEGESGVPEEGPPQAPSQKSPPPPQQRTSY